MNKSVFLILSLSLMLITCTGCGESSAKKESAMQAETPFHLETKVVDIINDPAFRGHGRLIFPVDRHISRDLALKDIGDILVWYNNVRPERTVEIVNYMKTQAQKGQQIFYDI